MIERLLTRYPGSVEARAKIKVMSLQSPFRSSFSPIGATMLVR